MQIDLDGNGRRYTRLLPTDCEVLGVVTKIAGDYHGALVKVTDGDVTIHNYSWVWMKLVLQQLSPMLETVKVTHTYRQRKSLPTC